MQCFCGREEEVPRLFSVLERHLVNIPAALENGAATDISLYDCIKLESALAACIWSFLQEDMERVAALRQPSFGDQKVFLLFSCDFSGIQKFIYNVVVEKTLKSLRARSFFLEIFLEHIADEVLDICGVSRSNLLYTGGGHAYLLLPNTAEVRNRLDGFRAGVNRWLQNNFGASLFLASAYAPCSMHDLLNIPQAAVPYQAVFRAVSRKMSRQKLQRYAPADMKLLNDAAPMAEKRECKVCGGMLAGRDDRCAWCRGFEALGGELNRAQLQVVVARTPPPGRPFLTLPGAQAEYVMFLAAAEEAALLREKGEARRVYRKNKRGSAAAATADIYLGDYVAEKSMENLAEQATGIRRIGIMRADVDNLGTAFTAGFAADKQNIVRTAAFSRQLSLFFKFYINTLLLRGNEEFSLTDKLRRQKQVTIVYSGGDDIFLAGAWDEIIESAVLLREAFRRFTLDKLSFSAGIGVFEDCYPIYHAAYDTADLEALAKANIDPNGRITKDSIALFTAAENHVYRWEVFEQRVVGEKLRLLQKFFGRRQEDRESGMSILYQLLAYLHGCGDRINIARYAYLLARLKPVQEDGETRRVYGEFSRRMYAWILCDEERRQLMTAIYLYIYLQRQRGNSCGK